MLYNTNFNCINLLKLLNKTQYIISPDDLNNIIYFVN